MSAPRCLSWLTRGFGRPARCLVMAALVSAHAGTPEDSVEQGEMTRAVEPVPAETTGTDTGTARPDDTDKARDRVLDGERDSLSGTSGRDEPAPPSPAAPEPERNGLEPGSEPSSKAATRLTMISEPCSAQVKIDGTPAGRTPLDRAVSPGAHSVSFSLEGHVPVTVTMSIAEDAADTLSAVLVPLVSEKSGDPGEGRRAEGKKSSMHGVALAVFALFGLTLILVELSEGD